LWLCWKIRETIITMMISTVVASRTSSREKPERGVRSAK
jgi:hypothetical protein